MIEEAVPETVHIDGFALTAPDGGAAGRRPNARSDRSDTGERSGCPAGGGQRPGRECSTMPILLGWLSTSA
jgi:hypothetical protein